MQLEQIVDRQKNTFLAGDLRETEQRLEALTRLEQQIRKHEEELYRAFQIDLSKSRAETYMAEISVVLQEIRYLKKHLRSWAKPETVRGTLGTFPAKSVIYKEPYGVVLVLAPWNYPLLLAVSPVAGALAAGNQVVLKCSKSSPNCARVIRTIMQDAFHEKQVYCVEPGTSYDEVLHQRYDYIFFTGSPRVGSQVMAAAAEQLIPVSLELGGKSPCIVTRSADLKMAARRIVWGKLLNAGQTCITVDYILVDPAVKEGLVRELQQEIRRRYPDAVHSAYYPRIITQKHFRRLTSLIEAEGKLGQLVTENGVHTGALEELWDSDERRIAPVLLPDADWDHPIMEEEIFGPVIPILEYRSLTQAVAAVNERPHPLACYIFTGSKPEAQFLRQSIPFGGGCINDTILHISNHHMPFGGVGRSGMGGYHGRDSFETFTHRKSMVENTTKVDVPIRYGPFTDGKWRILKKFL